MTDPRNNQGFIQVGGPTVQPPNPAPFRGAQPPPPPPPPQRAQSFPATSPPGMRPQDVRIQDLMRIREMQGAQQHQVAFPPPFHKIPPAFQSNVEISDIRQASQIEADAREALSDYVVFRFQKLDDPDNVDEDGYRVKPNWEQATKTRLDMSKQDAASHIRRLNKRWTVWEKKAALKPVQQRHFESTQQQLNQDEPDQRYYYELVQIDERKVDRRTVEYQRPSKSSRDVRKLVITRRGASVSREPSSKSHKKERLSLTGYFKRTPRPEESAKAMMSQRGQQTQRAYANDVVMFSPQNTNFSPQAQIQRAPPEMFVQQCALPSTQRLQIEPQVQRQALPPGQGQGQGQKAQSNIPPRPPIPQGQGSIQPKGQYNDKVQPNAPQVKNQNGQARNLPAQATPHKMPNNDKQNRISGEPFVVDQRSPRTSRGSVSSLSSTSSSGDSGFTPESSSLSDGSRPTGRGRRRSRSRIRGQSRSRQRPRDRQENYGIEAPRRHSRQEQHYFSDPLSQRVTVIPRPPSPPQSGPTQAEIRMMKDDAFRAGMAEGRASSRTLEARAVDDMEFAQRAIGPSATRPTIIQRRSSVRVVDPGEISRQRMMDEELSRFGQLRIDDDLRFDERRRLDGRLRFEDRPRLDERQRFDDRQQFDEEMAVMREMQREEEIRRHLALEHQIRLQQEEDEMFAAEEERIRQDRAIREHLMRRERSPSDVRFNNPFGPIEAGRANTSYNQMGYHR